MCHYTRIKDDLDKLKVSKATADIEDEAIRTSIEDLVEDIRGIIEKLECIAREYEDDDKIAGYIQCINEFLIAFNFDPLYPPFLLDRFILMAIVAETLGSTYWTEDAIQADLTGDWLYNGYAANIENEQ